jgi:hypothetical protein
MHCACGNVTAFSGSVGLRPATRSQRHLAIQNNVRRLRRVSVIGVMCVRPVLPHVGVSESFESQWNNWSKRNRMSSVVAVPIRTMVSYTGHRPFGAQGKNAVCATLSLTYWAGLQKRLRPPCDIGGCRRKGAPSSGEKLVQTYKINCWEERQVAQREISRSRARRVRLLVRCSPPAP